jgi:hypothetical protein
VASSVILWRVSTRGIQSQIGRSDMIMDVAGRSRYLFSSNLGKMWMADSWFGLYPRISWTRVNCAVVLQTYSGQQLNIIIITIIAKILLSSFTYLFIYVLNQHHTGQLWSKYEQAEEKTKWTPTHTPKTKQRKAKWGNLYHLTQWYNNDWIQGRLNSFL